jgi:predicted esterase
MLVLLVPGGRMNGNSRCHWWTPPVLRCWILGAALTRARTRGSMSVYLLKHASTGWDGDGRDVLADLSWALAELSQRHPDAPIALVGHSMGGRTAARWAGQPGIAGLVALAPWLPADDPVEQLSNVRLTVIQGSADREIPPAETDVFLARAVTAGALVTRVRIQGGEHLMLLRMRSWHLLTALHLVRLLG